MPHTPGPWVASADIDSRKQRGYRIDTPDFSLIAWVPEGYGDGPAEANAKLIAASPQLLAALTRALDWLASYPGNGAEGAYEQARAAINEATQTEGN